jgi:hypothetical protein
LFDLFTDSIFVSRDVVFHETIFPYHPCFTSSNPHFHDIVLPTPISDDDSPYSSSSNMNPVISFLFLLFVILLLTLFLFLIVVLIMFLILLCLSDNHPELNINLVIFRISIVNWLHPLFPLQLIIRVLLVILLLFSLFFRIINCHLLTNTMFFWFPLQLSPNIIMWQYNILAGVMPCKLRSRFLKIMILRH